MDRTIVLISLLVALLIVAVGYVIFCVGRVVVAIVKDHLESRKPRHEFRHADYGILTLDGGLWSGKARRGESEIPFVVAGSDTAPHSGLMERLSWFVSRFAELEQRALDFVRKREPSVRRGEFKFSSVTFLWEKNPEYFAMEFDLSGDDEGIWRVEFECDQPKSAGRDD